MNTVGVIVGRFQVDTFHVGHHALISQVIVKHSGKVFIVLGNTPVLNSERDPLDFQSRFHMIKTLYPTIAIGAIADNPSDHEWSKQLDEIIVTAFPGHIPFLYGSRDSFINQYNGKFRGNIIQIKHESGEISSSSIRESISRQVINSDDFRRGIIYAAANRYPTSFQVVDVAILHEPLDDPLILLGRKQFEREPGKLRFIGGFVDPTDESLEAAAAREVSEEVKGISTDHFEYLGSVRIDDWRYRNRRDKMMSAMFVCKYISGIPEASDDIAMLEWIPYRMALEGVEDEPMLISTHKQLGEMLRKYIHEQRKT